MQAFEKVLDQKENKLILDGIKNKLKEAQEEQEEYELIGDEEAQEKRDMNIV